MLTLKLCRLQLEDLHRQSEMNGASANVAREELRESSLRIDSLTAQLAAMQKEVSAYVHSLTFYALFECGRSSQCSYAK